MAAAAAIIIDGKEHRVTADERFVFGRTDTVDAEVGAVFGLDATDMGISAVAGSIEFDLGVWWIKNRSRKRPLLVELPSGPGRITLPPLRPYAITWERLTVLVVGAVWTHAIEVVPPAEYAAGLIGQGVEETGTLPAITVEFSDRERDALTAVFSSQLAAFPRRNAIPLGYSAAAAMLGGDWTEKKVAKAVDRVKEKFAREESLYFTGAAANFELGYHLINGGALTGEDLKRIQARSDG